MSDKPEKQNETEGFEDTKIDRRVIVRETEIEVPFSFTADNYQILARIVSFDQSRNKLILDDIKKLATENQKILVLSERKEHLEVLNMCLKGVCETIVITGDDSTSARKTKFAQIESGHYQVILATGQLFGEGIDIPDIPVGFRRQAFTIHRSNSWSTKNGLRLPRCQNQISRSAV
ncbi:MAG: Type III restriction enzyme, res subunit:DEAD/DEAH box helicase [Candidatus Uhrbacteria bacterium GW2011_GWF2_44_350]|uniref:Type III restriction enzyme, res subunit:DEAD/DEAH box helicase n=1 Tax=Candidatus Uhrbacteria bacterium GW2011_GWF2_44_350 TaxID=1619000 RepID=A0A0G1J8R1_9BACT|nr:MAG: Type III restriction enzyme, res subunit:DEAD/DEAH box helicase [Candidatus Uhrbacteria bacterium GW2011_GWF2_44_350]